MKLADLKEKLPLLGAEAEKESQQLGQEKLEGLKHLSAEETKKRIEAIRSAGARISAANKGRVFSDEHREKLSQAKTGTHHSEETRAKMSASRTGRRLSDEHRAKLSAARKGWNPSPETRERMRQAKLGRPGHAPSPENLARLAEGRRIARALREQQAVSVPSQEL